MSNYYDRYWQKKGNDKQEDFPYKWPIIRKFLPKKEGLVFLDYGCGSGQVLKEIIKMYPKNKYIGIDVSKEILKKARKKLPKVKFHPTEDGKKLKLKASSVDFIVALDVIEHIYNTEIIFSEFKRVLRPGGRMLISTPYFGLLKSIAICVLGFERVFNPKGPHIRYYTEGSLKKCLDEVNLKIISKGYFGRFYPFCRGMYVLVQKNKK